MRDLILVMDNDYLSNWFLTKSLREMGHCVITVSDKDAMMKRLSVERFHAVVVRVEPSSQSTESAVEEIQSLYPDVRVIAYVPYGGTTLKQELDNIKVRYFLYPFRPNEIRQAFV